MNNVIDNKSNQELIGLYQKKTASRRKKKYGHYIAGGIFALSEAPISYGIYSHRDDYPTIVKLALTASIFFIFSLLLLNKAWHYSKAEVEARTRLKELTDDSQSHVLKISNYGSIQ